MSKHATAATRQQTGSTVPGTGAQTVPVTDLIYRQAAGKITPLHLRLRAVVYVRQSTPQQVLEHTESTARQYALVDRAVALGWPRSAVD